MTHARAWKYPEPGIAGAGKFYFWAAENLLNLFPVRKQITAL